MPQRHRESDVRQEMLGNKGNWVSKINAAGELCKQQMAVSDGDEGN